MNRQGEPPLFGTCLKSIADGNDILSMLRVWCKPCGDQSEKDSRENFLNVDKLRIIKNSLVMSSTAVAFYKYWI